VQSNYQGAVHLVNPNGGTLLGKSLIRNIAAIPDPVDLAVILIPAPSIPQALLECAGRGIPAAIIASGGFRETGAEGARLEVECLRIARENHIRIVGPNSIGLLDTHLPIDVTFLPPPGPTPGDVAFISHSGAICAAVIDWARGQGFGLSRLVSLGNQADVNETDVLEPVAADPFTRVLALYLEGVSDGRRFVQEASKVSLRKPVIALKVGRFASGQRAVASHTGALAGQEVAFNAAFRRAGVIRAETSEEMFDWARSLAWCPVPAGRSVAVLTNAGGPGVTAADALEANHLRLAELSETTKRALYELLPPAASLHNPVDMLASASPEQYAASLRLLVADPNVDSVLVILPPPPMFTAGAVAKAMIPTIHMAGKPVVIALMGERLIQEAVEHFRAARVPEYRFPERAASALAILVERAEYLQRMEKRGNAGSSVSINGTDREAVRTILGDNAHKPGFLTAPVAARILAAYGIPLPGEGIARSEEEAVGLAEAIGYPVALKIVSADVPHKSDAGGVLLGVEDAKGVRRGYQEVLQRVAKACPGAQIEGIEVQKIVPAGQDVIVGAIQDPQFGPLMMFGSGGVEVEGLHDVAFGLAPLTQEEAEYLLAETWAGRKLKGYRNLHPADRLGALDALQRVSQLAADFPQLSEVEINPLRVLAEGQGVVAVDIRMKLAAL
jgi:acetyltransferase